MKRFLILLFILTPVFSTAQKTSAASNPAPPFQLADRFYFAHTGVSDLLTLNPFLSGYDLLEMGQPRFVAPFNMYPQQSEIYVDGFWLNDPVNGHYNYRLLSADQSGGYGINRARDAVEIGLWHKKYKEKPFTQLKYVEGDFGFSDLDIFFSRALGAQTDMLLSGYTRGYDGWTIRNSGHDGFSYRAELGFNIGNVVQSRLGWWYARHRTGMINSSFYNDYRFAERQNQFFLTNRFLADSLWYVPSRADIFVRHGRRTYASNTGQFQLRERYDQVQTVLEKSYNIAAGELKLSSRLEALRYWGGVFDGAYGETRGSVAAAMHDILGIPLFADARAKYHGDNSGLDGSAGAYWQLPTSKVTFAVSRRARLPVAMERFYKSNGVSGSRLLNNEIMRHIYGTWQADSSGMFSWSLAGGIRQLDDEIMLNAQQQFINGSQRNWSYAEGNLGFTWWQLRLNAAFQHVVSGKSLHSPTTLNVSLTYQDRWFDTVGFIATGRLNWYDGFNRMQFNPTVQRFMSGTTTPQEAFFVSSGYFAIIVKDAHLFFEISNPMSKKYAFVDGYFDQFRRIRFGLNWEFWN